MPRNDDNEADPSGIGTVFAMKAHHRRTSDAATRETEPPEAPEAAQEPVLGSIRRRNQQRASVLHSMACLSCGEWCCPSSRCGAIEGCACDCPACPPPSDRTASR